MVPQFAISSGFGSVPVHIVNINLTTSIQVCVVQLI